MSDRREGETQADETQARPVRLGELQLPEGIDAEIIAEFVAAQRLALEAIEREDLRGSRSEIVRSHTFQSEIRTETLSAMLRNLS